MYKCVDCGHLFEEGEQRTYKEAHGFSDGFAEEFSVCPVCGGDYEETTRCAFCGGEHLESELYDGVCLDCLRKKATYANILNYLIDTDALCLFMMESVYDTPVPDKPSEKLKNMLAEQFARLRNDDLLRNKTDFLGLACKFIFVDDGDYGKENFAEWLNSKRKAVTVCLRKSARRL